ncbi:alpha/beta hydrolase [Paracoccus sp. TK19116]|uniref:Alpha/beta hydrolase n=1 Tax=Paracoccus albicereus TaxID=2922394 RepID=A0ABT1MTB6_9RHOB|nr:alpha/beta hydrolase [Paracoccus albicereus]MCQ0971565.1 alpha/beta hydrolase [Paracoccus albicereus]
MRILPAPFRLFALGLAALALSACSGAQVLNTLTTASGVTIERDVRYGPEARQAYDLYRPENGEPKGAIVYYYGGSWDTGSRDMYRFLGTTLAKRGYVVAVPDYRLYPEVTFPAFVEDGALAFRAVRERMGADLPMFVMGHSAGAYIGGMLAFAPRYLQAQGMSPCGDVAGFIGISGPYDFRISGRYDPMFPQDSRDISQVLPFAKDGQHPPSLLIHGTSDKTVEPRQTRDLAEALQRSGDSAELQMVEGAGHIDIIGAIAWPLRFTAPTLDLVTEFADGIAADSPGCG